MMICVLFAATLAGSVFSYYFSPMGWGSQTIQESDSYTYSETVTPSGNLEPNDDGTEGVLSRQGTPNQSSANMKDAFFYPLMINRHIMDRSIDRKKDLYNHCCLNWKDGYNRLFFSTLTENKKDLKTIDQMLRYGTDVMTHKATTDYEVIKRNEGSFFLNQEMVKHYKSCVDFYRSPSNVGAESMRNTLRTLTKIIRLQSKKDVFNVFADLSSHGIGGPLNPILREVPYFLSELINDRYLSGKQFKRVVLLELSSFSEHQNTWSFVRDEKRIISSFNEWTNRFFQSSTFDGYALTEFGNSEVVSISKAIKIGQQIENAIASSRKRNERTKEQFVDDHLGSIMSKNETGRTFEALFGDTVNFDRFIERSKVGDGNADLVYVESLEYLTRLSWILDNFGLDYWKSYIVFLCHCSLMQRTPPLEYVASLSDHQTSSSDGAISRLCLDHTKQLFPISHCNTFATYGSDYYSRRTKIAKISRNVLRVVTDSIRSTCHGSNDQKTRQGSGWCKMDEVKCKALLDHLERLEISIGDCVVHESESRMAENISREKYGSLLGIEMRNGVKEDDFIGNLVKVTSDSDFRLYRRWFHDQSRKTFFENNKKRNTQYQQPQDVESIVGSFSSAYEEKYKDVNAWYDPLYHRLVIPVAFLRPPSFSSLYNDLSLYASFGFVFAHEIVHSTESIVYDDEATEDNNSCQMKHFWKLLKLYPNPKGFTFPRQSVSPQSASSPFFREHWYGIQTFYENRADWLALDSALGAWKLYGTTETKGGEEDDFFTVFSQVWCSGDPERTTGGSSNQKSLEEYDDVHALPKHRVNIPFALVNKK